MFEWDEEKNAVNIRKHGIRFEDAIRIFDGFVATEVDDRHDYGEVRMISLGAVDDIVVLAIVHTDREGITRIISARQANRAERKRYEEAAIR
jgi:uncharacterized DUF497 family protein